jgi:3D (Asp-Asp-Asp) domain-containing protein
MLSLAAGCGGGEQPGGGGMPDLGGGGVGGGNSGPQTLLNVFVTWYGFNDNSCQVETDHNCNTIAFSKMDGFPTRHDIATEGAGTYADPSTFATAAADSGDPAEFPVGTIIYIPYVRKYFIMEDQCVECGDEWDAKKAYHVDMWMGPSYGSDDTALMNCEDELTLGDGTFQGTGTIIVNPPPDLPVETAPLFSNGVCTTKTYSNE